MNEACMHDCSCVHSQVEALFMVGSCQSYAAIAIGAGFSAGSNFGSFKDE
jgi:hypothetical protein